MPDAFRAFLLALALGLGAACFQDDFLLGARCSRDSDCGDEHCCAGLRCRPDTADHCERGAGKDWADDPYPWAYTVCEGDADCLVHGMPHCVILADAPAGFCADLCYGLEANCEKHPESESRICLEIDDQRLCALRCCAESCSPNDPCPGQTDCPEPCPGDMQCLESVCVPQAAP